MARETNGRVYSFPRYLVGDAEVSGSDVTALRAANKWVVDLVESSRLPMVALDDDRRYVALSDTAEAVHVGRSRDDMHGRQVDEFLDPESAREFLERFDELQASGVVTSRVVIRGEDGFTREVTSLFSSHVAPGINLAVTLSGVEIPAELGEGTRRTSVLVGAPDELATSIASTTCSLDRCLEVVAECSELERLGAMVLGHRPKVVVVSTSPFGGGDGEPVADAIVRAVEEVVGVAEANSIDTRVLVFTHLSRPDVVREVIRAGALGVFGPNETAARFPEAIRSVAAGEAYVSPSLATAIAGIERGGALAEMSPREIEVLRLLALGHTNQEVAEELFLSVRTIETYHANINRSLGSSKRKDLVAFALSNQVIP